MAEQSVGPSLIELNAAQETGVRSGLLSAAAAVYLLYIGPDRLFALGPTAGDLLVVRAAGAAPYIGVAAATTAVGFLTALGYVVTGRGQSSSDRSDLATGVVIPPAVVVFTGFAAIVLEPVGNKLLAGEFVAALGLLGIEIVVLVLLLLSWVGQLLALLFFLLYLWLPAHAGTFAGSLVGKAGRLAGQTVFPPRRRE